MVDAFLSTLVMLVGASTFGFGALAASLAGPHKLVLVAVMLMMVAMSYRSVDLDL